MEVSQQEQPRKRICGPYRQIPCQTRSLSVQHNGEDTAYFVVPHNAPHHMPLSCSHAAECSNSGRRFCYCNGKSPRRALSWSIVVMVFFAWPIIKVSHTLAIHFITVCELPVAERNFVKERHDQGLVKSGKELQETVDRMMWPSIQLCRTPMDQFSPLKYTSSREISSSIVALYISCIYMGKVTIYATYRSTTCIII